MYFAVITKVSRFSDVVAESGEEADSAVEEALATLDKQYKQTVQKYII